MSGVDRSRGGPALLLAGAVLAEVTGSLSLKAAVDRPWLYLVVVIGYGVAFTLLASTLCAGMPLGVAYGLWAACGVALTAVLSHLLFAEPISLLMAVGLLLVMGGVLCVELGARDAQHGAGQDRSGA